MRGKASGRRAARPPTLVNAKVPPRRPSNAELRTREYLTADEVDRLIAAAKKIGRHGHRDATLILLAFRHGLRASEIAALRWDQVDLKVGRLHVNRLKNGTHSVHPLRGPELRALRRLRREYPDSPYVFVTERGGPLSAPSVRVIVKRAGDVAGLAFPVHPHMLRHYPECRTMPSGHDLQRDIPVLDAVRAAGHSA